MRGVVGHGRVADDGVPGLGLRHLLDGVGADVRIEACRQLVAVHEEDLLAGEHALLDLRRVRDAELWQHLEEQIQVGASLLHVVGEVEEALLGNLARREVEVLEVRGVDAQHAEAQVGIRLWLGAELELLIGFIDFIGDFLARTADTLLAKIANRLEAELPCFRSLIEEFRNLHKNPLGSYFLVGIKIQSSMRSGSRSREEVENNLAFFYSSKLHAALNQGRRLGRIENV